MKNVNPVLGKIMIIFIYIFIFSLASCKKNDIRHDATGTFESNEIIISSETNGKITFFDLNEGDRIEEGQIIARIDSSGLLLQKEQAEASLTALSMKQNSPIPQILVFDKQLNVAQTQIEAQNEQIKILKKEQKRVHELYNGQGATEQQLDEIDGKVELLRKQIEIAENQKSVIQSQIKSVKEQINIQNRGINSETMPLKKRVELMDDQINKTNIKTPKSGTILTKYADMGEYIGIGKPVLKLADLTVMTLKAYITGNQLPNVKIGQEVVVYIDNGDNDYHSYQGKITSISEKAEFTPKTIQTKEERANLVYPIKILVKNDGKIKIGMYGEVSLKPNESNK